MISFKVNPESLKNLERAIACKVAEVTERAVVLVYKSIVTDDHSSSPYHSATSDVTKAPVYSGAFMASWNISIGSPDMSYKLAPGVHLTQPVYSFPTMAKAAGFSYPVGSFEPVHISNNAHSKQFPMGTQPITGYAGEVENVGTPFHLQPWKIALHSKNQMMQQFKLF